MSEYPIEIKDDDEDSDKDEDNDEESTQFVTIDIVEYQELMKDDRHGQDSCGYHGLTSSLSRKTCNIFKLRDSFNRFDCNNH